MSACSECCVSASRRAGRAGEQERELMMKHSKTAKKEKKRKASHLPSKLACVTQSPHVIPSKKRLCVRTSDEGCVHLDPILYSTYRMHYYITILSKHYFSNQAVFHSNEYLLHTEHPYHGQPNVEFIMRSTFFHRTKFLFGCKLINDGLVNIFHQHEMRIV